MSRFITYFLHLIVFFNLCYCIKSIRNGTLPVYFDWRTHNGVSPVKNQWGCNACWAFSAVACIESHLKIYLSIEEILSEQFLIDCDPSHVGCNSASVLKTYGNIVNYFGGVLRNSDYNPFDAKPHHCSWNHITKPIPVIGYRRVQPDEKLMLWYVVNRGPLSVAINSASMEKYKDGIDEPTDESCPPQKTNHAVLIVGFNVYEDASRKVPYWIIKNSWGTTWGDKGYYYLVRGRNACGIATDVSFPFVN